MEEGVPSITSNPGSVGSRFVSQNDIDSANSRRDEQWKAAYARLGQEPPPRPQEDVFDGRSLAEKLAANKIAKQEEWEEKTKLANQFRALEEDEVQFLDLIRSEQERKEKERNAEDAEEVKGFKEAVASRNNTLGDKPDFSPPALVPSSSSSLSLSSSTKEKAKAASTTSGPPAKKAKAGGLKGGLKGVVLKKKPTVAMKPAEKAGSEQAAKTTTKEVEKRKVAEAESKAGVGAKKQKMS